MKRRFLFLLAVMLLVAVKGYGQDYSVIFKNASPRDAIEILRKATGLDFVYQKSLLDDNDSRVNGNYKNMSLHEILDKTIVNQLNMSYKLTGSTVSINKPEIKSTDKKEIYGIIVDEDGEPLAGATVYLKGSNGVGVAADINGQFTLPVTQPLNEITITYVGMKPLTLKVRAGANIPIRMESIDNQLNEMVVTGYQTISKERATGAFAKINSDDLKSQRISSVNDMLEGHIAGYNDGKIRGITSMQGITTPLYVIDGFPVESTRVDYAGGGFSEYAPNINVDDIESITVLKDAAATSIYGARAANGVVVITTKKAKSGKVNVSANATFSINPYKRDDSFSADSRDVIAMAREWIDQNPAFHQDGASDYALNMLKNSSNLAPHYKAIYQRYAGLMTETELNSMLDSWSRQGFRYYDEADALAKRSAFSQRYNLTVSSSSDKNSIVATISYHKYDAHDRYTFSQGLDLSLRNTMNLTSWAALDLGASLNYADNKNQTFNLYSPGFSVVPYMSMYADDGSTIVSRMEDRLDQSRLNAIRQYGLYDEDIDPIDELGRSIKTNSDLVTRFYARLNLNFTDWLRFTSQFQYEFGNYQDKQIFDKNTYYVRNRVNNFASTNDGESPVFNLPYGDIYAHGTNDQRAYNFRNQLDFNKTFGDANQVTAIAGFEMRHNKTRYEHNTLYGYDDQLNSWTMIDQNLIQSFTGAIFSRPWTSASDFSSIDELTNRFISFYANAAYSYDDKYIATASIRTDRTNLYGTSSKYQGKPIWSVGGAWRIDRESFMHLSNVNMLKLRFSYGIGGNIAKNHWPYTVAYYTPNTHPGVGGIQGSISSRPNPKLRWEKTTTINVGVDFSLFGNRLNGSVEYYDKKGSDLLASVNGVPVEGQGYTTNTINNGKMINNGVEITLNGNIIDNRDWLWNLQGILGYNHSKVTHVEVEAPFYILQLDYPESFPRVGVPFTALYGYKYAGLSEEGLPQVYDANGEIYSSFQPTNLEDIIYLGSYTPTFSGSVSSNLKWKQLTLSALLLFEGGHKLRCTDFKYDDRWKKPGDESRTDVPRYVVAENPDLYCNMDLYNQSSAVVRDAKNATLKNISLTYTLPSYICSKFYTKEVSIKFGIENLATFASKPIKHILGANRKPNYVMSLYINL